MVRSTATRSEYSTLSDDHRSTLTSSSANDITIILDNKSQKSPGTNLRKFVLFYMNFI